MDKRWRAAVLDRERADTLFVCGQVRKAAAQRQPQRAERAMDKRWRCCTGERAGARFSSGGGGGERGERERERESQRAERAVGQSGAPLRCPGRGSEQTRASSAGK